MDKHTFKNKWTLWRLQDVNSLAGLLRLPAREAGGPTWDTSSRTWSHTSKYSLASPYTRLYSVCIECGLVWAFVDCHARLDFKHDFFPS